MGKVANIKYQILTKTSNETSPRKQVTIAKTLISIIMRIPTHPSISKEKK